MGHQVRSFGILFTALLATAQLLAQASAPTAGEITVRLTQGLDSSADVNGKSQGKVIKSTSSAIPSGTQVMMGVEADAASGGYVVKLLELGINGQALQANSSDVVPAPDFINRAQEKMRGPGQPQDAAKGSRIFLPRNMIVRFTLAPPDAAAPQSHQAPPAGPTVLTPISPSSGPVGAETFNPQTAPNLKIATVDSLTERVKAATGITTILQAGLESSFSTFNARENIIVNGEIQPHPPGFFHGVRGVRVNPGSVVLILDVRALDDGEHDVLHIVLEDQTLPTFINVAFVFPKGQLGTLTDSDLAKTVMPFFAVPAPQSPNRSSVSGGTAGTSNGGGQYKYVVEGIGLGMPLDQVRAAVKAAGSIKGLISQGGTGTTYRARTKDLEFQITFEHSRVIQYNVTATNPRHLPEDQHSGPLHAILTHAFGPEDTWGNAVVYDLGEGTGAYAIVSDLSKFP